MRLPVNSVWRSKIGVFLVGIILLGLAPTKVQAQKVFNGPGGGEVTIEETEIKLVDGPGNWIIWGNGQDLTITEKKDGEGSLTLRGFGKITINLKNGPGKLVIEDDNREVILKKVDGPGDVTLRLRGRKKIDDKNGPGNVLFCGSPPIIGRWDGPGKSMRASDCNSAPK